MGCNFRKLSFVLALIVCVTMSFGCLESAAALSGDEVLNTETVFDTEAISGEDVSAAEVVNEEDSTEPEDNADPEGTVEAKDADDNQTVLEVYQDNQLKKAYSMDDLWAMADAGQYTFSSFNSWPSAGLSENVKGTAIKAILDDAGLTSLSGNQTIEITASDGVKETFLISQLLAERYYYPYFRNEAGRAGKAALASSKAGRQVVPAMLRLNEPNSTTGRLYFGQLSPTEQNHSHFIKYVNKITVYSLNSRAVSKWNALKTTSAGTGGPVKRGTVLTLNRNINANPSTPGDRYCIYYTTDGSTPDMSSNIYNYNNYYFGSPKEQFNKPTISSAGNVTIKTRIIGYGKLDSDISTFTFNGVNAPPTPKITKITAKKKAVTLKWKKVSGVKGYKIYRSTSKNGTYSLVKTITKAKTVKWKNSGLKRKTTYYYKITTYKMVSGRSIDSNYSAVKYKKTK